MSIPATPALSPRGSVVAQGEGSGALAVCGIPWPAMPAPVRLPLLPTCWVGAPEDEAP